MANSVRFFPMRELLQKFTAPAVDVFRQTHSRADMRATSPWVEVWSDAAGAFDPCDEDQPVTFYEDNVEVASRTINGVLAAGAFTLTTADTSGEETTVVFHDNGTSSARAEVTHVRTNFVSSAYFSAKDLSAAGVTIFT